MFIVDDDLRLRSAQLPEDIKISLTWYQDIEVLHYSEGEGTQPYEMDTIETMYKHLIYH